MEYKFSACKRPLLKDFIRDFINQMNLAQINVEILLMVDCCFSYQLLCSIDYSNLYDSDNFLRDNDKLKVMSVVVTPDSKYIIKCC